MRALEEIGAVEGPLTAYDYDFLCEACGGLVRAPDRQACVKAKVDATLCRPCVDRWRAIQRELARPRRECQACGGEYVLRADNGCYCGAPRRASLNRCPDCLEARRPTRRQVETAERMRLARVVSRM